ncbi:MAG: hypothetical protein HQL51_16800 [Magnetococcales bacterium]|nr:hypothetical protein [Magnetococcales bacterium]
MSAVMEQLRKSEEDRVRLQTQMAAMLKRLDEMEKEKLTAATEGEELLLLLAGGVGAALVLGGGFYGVRRRRAAEAAASPAAPIAPPVMVEPAKPAAKGMSLPWRRDGGEAKPNASPGKPREEPSLPEIVQAAPPVAQRVGLLDRYRKKESPAVASTAPDSGEVELKETPAPRRVSWRSLVDRVIRAKRPQAAGGSAELRNAPTLADAPHPISTTARRFAGASAVVGVGAGAVQAKAVNAAAEVEEEGEDDALALMREALQAMQQMGELAASSTPSPAPSGGAPGWESPVPPPAPLDPSRESPAGEPPMAREETVSPESEGDEASSGVPSTSAVGGSSDLGDDHGAYPPLNSLLQSAEATMWSPEADASTLGGGADADGEGEATPAESSSFMGEGEGGVFELSADDGGGLAGLLSPLELSTASQGMARDGEATLSLSAHGEEMDLSALAGQLGDLSAVFHRKEEPSGESDGTLELDSGSHEMDLGSLVQAIGLESAAPEGDLLPARSDETLELGGGDEGGEGLSALAAHLTRQAATPPSRDAKGVTELSGADLVLELPEFSLPSAAESSLAFPSAPPEPSSGKIEEKEGASAKSGGRSPSKTLEWKPDHANLGFSLELIVDDGPKKEA